MTPGERANDTLYGGSQPGFQMAFPLAQEMGERIERAITAAIAEERDRCISVMTKPCSMCLHDDCKAVRRCIAAIRAQP